MLRYFGERVAILFSCATFDKRLWLLDCGPLFFSGIGNVTQALEAKGMLNNTLIVFTSDNGEGEEYPASVGQTLAAPTPSSPIHDGLSPAPATSYPPSLIAGQPCCPVGGPSTTGDGVGARNWPLRGAKHSIWEGGVRATAFVSGAGIQNPGSTYKGLMHGADWLPTLSSVAGFDLQGTLPLDGVDQWAAFNAPEVPASYPRQYVVLGNSTNACRVAAQRQAASASDAAAKPACGFGVHLNDGVHGWKLIKGYGGAPDTWCNTTHGQPVCLHKPLPSNGSCPDGWCLYDVQADPEEFAECSAQHPDVVKSLQARMAASLTTYTQ